MNSSEAPRRKMHPYQISLKGLSKSMYHYRVAYAKGDDTTIV